MCWWKPLTPVPERAVSDTASPAAPTSCSQTRSGHSQQQARTSCSHTSPLNALSAPLASPFLSTPALLVRYHVLIPPTSTVVMGRIIIKPFSSRGGVTRHWHLRPNISEVHQHPPHQRADHTLPEYEKRRPCQKPCWVHCPLTESAVVVTALQFSSRPVKNTKYNSSKWDLLSSYKTLLPKQKADLFFSWQMSCYY